MNDIIKLKLDLITTTFWSESHMKHLTSKVSAALGSRPTAGFIVPAAAAD